MGSLVACARDPVLHAVAVLLAELIGVLTCVYWLQVRGVKVLGALILASLVPARWAASGKRVPHRLRGLDLKGKTALVTDGHVGVGRATAVQLLRWGCQVIIVCSASGKDAVPAATGLRREAGLDDNSGRLRVRLVDLSDLSSIEHLVDGLRDEPVEVDIFVNGAGVDRVANGTKITKAGEVPFTVNGIGHFFLTYRLMKSVMASNARIIHVVWGGGTKSEPPIAQLQDIQTRWTAFELAQSLQQQKDTTKDFITQQDLSYQQLLSLPPKYVNSSTAVLSLVSEVANGNHGKRITGALMVDKDLGRSTLGGFDSRDKAPAGGVAIYGCHSGSISLRLSRHFEIYGFSIKPFLTWLLSCLFYKTPREAAQTEIYLCSEAASALIRGGYYSNVRLAAPHV